MNIKYQKVQWDEDGNGAGQVRRIGSSPPPGKILSCSIPCPTPHDEKNFLPHPRPLGPRETPPHIVKLYFLLIYPTISTIFLMKPISLLKIYLKLQLNLSHQIKSIFRKKKLNNISKYLTRQSHKKKKKSHSITHNKIKAKNHIR